MPSLHLPMRDLTVHELFDETSKRLYLPPTMWMIPKLPTAGLLSNLGENRRTLALKTQLLVAQDMTPVFEITGAAKPHASDAKDTQRSLLVNHQVITLLVTQMFALVPRGQLSHELIGKPPKLLQAHVLRVDQSLNKTFQRIMRKGRRGDRVGVEQ